MGEVHNLKRSVTLMQALGITFHQIVGGGILAILGSAITFTGGGVPIAVVITAIALPLATIPYAALASALPTAGGMYKYAARILHPGVGFLNLGFVVLSQITVGVLGLTAGVYLQSLAGWINPHAVAITLILFFFVINLLGASFSARIGLVLALIMLVGYMTFIVGGFLHVDWAHYPAVLPNGVGGLLQASALLTFVLGGGTFVAELGGEMRNPGRTIPISIIGGTLFAGVLYILLAIPAVGVLPIPEVAGKPLTVVAEQVLPHPLFVFFVIGGGLVASLGTMNSSMTWGTKGLLIAISDGWFPARFGAVNKRFGTPHYLLVAVTVIGLAPVLLGYGIEEIASGVAAFLSIGFIILSGASVRLRRLRPDLFEAASFRLQWAAHLVCAALSVPVLGVTAYLLLTRLSAATLIGLGVWFVACACWYAVRYPRIKDELRQRSRELLGRQPSTKPAHTPVPAE
ncbi:amino acid permease [Rhodococcus sp. D2-41]|uniref:APC family permease n=1 Tax=Speluncibacter jeojiensis TaxID=2710754 RepID=UPI00240F1052|nr:APC family permease [Rhodococcus sp. D2-41]MDG3012638.1 amino acid permease [Rhodococcus sp. D2-41]